MQEIVGLLAAPFAACLLIAGLHCYMGLHVIKRGVIFVDLALAQLAALGAAVALLLGPLVFVEPIHQHSDTHFGHGEAQEVTEDQIAQLLLEHEHETPSGFGPRDTWEAHEDKVAHSHVGWLKEQLPYILSLVFALFGAGIFAWGRFRDERVPQEAIIGIVFVVSAALSILVLSRAPHGHEKMEAMLVGSILFVGWPDVLMTLLLYVPLAILHYVIRRRLVFISQDIRAAESAGVPVRGWDLVFYATFGLMVTQSVRIAGVLVVFSYLIIPAACAAMLAGGFSRRLFLAWGIALIASVLGLAFSATTDMPTGPSLVAVFGAILVLCAAIRPLVAPNTRLARCSTRTGQSIDRRARNG